jgi:methylmalonyl-CoA epimerase
MKLSISPQQYPNVTREILLRSARQDTILLKNKISQQNLPMLKSAVKEHFSLIQVRPMTSPRPFSILSIDHLGIVPKDLAKARWFFATVLQLANLGEESIASEAVDICMLDSQHNAASSTEKTSFPRLELLSPQHADSPISSYLEKRGGGIHHLAFRVDNIRVAIEFLTKQGVQLLSSTPRPGAHGSEVVFVHPKSTGGILVELVSSS